MRNISIILFNLCIFPALLSAQAYEGHGRNPEEFNKDLSALKTGSTVELLDSSGTGSFNNWCTSFLAPEGDKPVKTEKMDIDLREYEWAVDEWSCMYSPQRAQDGNPKTAWCEDADGIGIGETIIVKLDVEKPVKIWNGFGQSNLTYLRNSRPKEVQISVLIASKKDVTQSGEIYKDLKVVAQGNTTLKDLNNYQPLDIPKVRVPKGKEGLTFIAVKIVSVYKGTKWEDTCISEVSN